MNPPPPPPPPHGENPKSSGLPPGKYDIFIIPEHSAGSGFLYLPSLRTNPASFGAGFATALICVALWTVLTPVVQAWWRGVRHSGGMGMIMVMLAIAVGAWALGRMQIDGGPGPGGGGGGSSGTSGSAPPPNGHAAGGGPGASSGFGGNPQPNASGYPPGGSYGGASGFSGAPPPNAHGYAGSAGAGAGNGYGNNSQHNASGYAQGAGFGGAGGFQGAQQPNTGGYAAGSTPNPGAGSSMPGGERPKPTWQRANPGAGSSGANTAKGTWEKAREETKKREEERKAKEAEKKRKEENERKVKEAREKEAREREAREKMQKEAREKIERELREKLERETREKIERETREKFEREAREKLEREDREKKEKEKQDEKDTVTKPKGSTYAFSAVGERTNPWPNGAPPAKGLPPLSPSLTKKPPPPPTARTYLGTEDDTHSYRPYDKPKKPTHKKSHSSLYSESSYAASHTTAQTTPPPSRRGPYSTKDPDKIVIKAVYSFTNAFLKTPTSQLVSGVGSVTDGLILRITTEGLFIDDDVRGVPQREWDVKAWTLKLVEVWCPSFRQGPAGNSTSASARASNPVRRLWNFEKDKAAVNEEADALLIEMLQVCKDTCRFLPTSSSSDGSATGSPYKSSNRYRSQQTGQLKNAHLHVLRASIRDQEGKRYVFVITEEESWKVSVGLQRLRRGTQVRQLGVSTMTSADSRTTLENLGWT